MNKRIKKKRKLLELVAQLQEANDLQQEVIEDYGRQLSEAKIRFSWMSGASIGP